MVVVGHSKVINVTGKGLGCKFNCLGWRFMCCFRLRISI